MRAHWSYLRYVLWHKWFVFLECIKLGMIWRGIVHDWHKFLPSEWLPYVHHFHNPDGSSKIVRDKTGYYKPTDTGDRAFDFAWLLHQKRGRHHWQWWVLPEDGGGVKVLYMSDEYRKEMLADWRGAARAQGFPRESVSAWYLEHKSKMQLHHHTRRLVEAELGVRDG